MNKMYLAHPIFVQVTCSVERFLVQSGSNGQPFAREEMFKDEIGTFVESLWTHLFQNETFRLPFIHFVHTCDTANEFNWKDRPHRTKAERRMASFTRLRESSSLSCCKSPIGRFQEKVALFIFSFSIKSLRYSFHKPLEKLSPISHPIRWRHLSSERGIKLNNKLCNHQNVVKAQRKACNWSLYQPEAGNMSAR